MDAIDHFFSSIDCRHYNLLESVAATVRIDVGEAAHVRRYRIEIDSGDVRSSRSEAGADCVVIVDEPAFVEILSGTETFITMLIRSSISLQGDLRLFFLLSRLLKHPANHHHSD